MYLKFYRPLEEVPRCWEEGSPSRMLDSLPESDLGVWFLRLEKSLEACGIPQDQWPGVATALLGGELKIKMDQFNKSKREPFALDLDHHWEELKAHATESGAQVANTYEEFKPVVGKIFDDVKNDFEKLKVNAEKTGVEAADDWEKSNLTVEKISHGAKNDLEKLKTNMEKTGVEAAGRWEEFKATLSKISNDAKDSLGPTIQTMGHSVQAFHDENPIAVIAAGAVLGSIGIALLAPPIAAATLGLLGFGSAGPVAGTIAAASQSMIYGGATGGLFSVLQSASMTAVTPHVATIVAGSLSSVGGGFLAWDGWSVHKNRLPVDAVIVESDGGYQVSLVADNGDDVDGKSGSGETSSSTV